MPTMYGPAFNETGELVERQVPEHDVQAYRLAGYEIGFLPEQPKVETPKVEQPKPTKPKRTK